MKKQTNNAVPPVPLARIVRPVVACPRCSGAGTVPMNRELFETCEYIVTQKWADGTFSAVEVAEDLSCGATTMNNRLSTLQKLGLIELSEKSGKTLRFRRANVKGVAPLPAGAIAETEVKP